MACKNQRNQMSDRRTDHITFYVFSLVSAWSKRLPNDVPCMGRPADVKNVGGLDTRPSSLYLRCSPRRHLSCRVSVSLTVDFCLFPIDFCQFPVDFFANSLLTFFCQFPVDVCLFPVNFCLLPVTFCPFPVKFCLFSVDFCPLVVDFCLLPVILMSFSCHISPLFSANVIILFWYYVIFCRVVKKLTEK